MIPNITWLSRFALLLAMSCCPGAVGPGRPAAPPVSDAIAVHAMYRKLWIAWRVHTLHESEFNQRTTDRGDLRLELSAIKEGPVGEIADKSLADLVTRPAGRVLSFTPGTWSLKLEDAQELHAQEASPGWNSYKSEFPENRNVSFGKLFELGTIDRGYARYVSFKVRFAYRDPKFDYTYRALVLFGARGNGKGLVLALDKIAGGWGALQAQVGPAVFPDVLLAEPWRSNPEAKEFLDSIRAQPGCSTEPVTHLCCDPASGRCGIKSNEPAADEGSN